MSPYEFFRHPDAQPSSEINQHDRDWREVLGMYPARQQEFDNLHPEAQELVASRLDLQERLRQAASDVTKHKLIFDRLVGNIIDRKSQGKLVDVGPLDTARQNQSEAYKEYYQVTATVIDVEAKLCWQGLRSGPFLELLEKRHGQALDDDPADTLPSLETTRDAYYDTLPDAG